MMASFLRHMTSVLDVIDLKGNLFGSAINLLSFIFIASRFAHLEKLSLNFSSSSFVIRVNLLHS